jgi:GTP-binding protein EngB required for normal cell division
LPFIVVATKVDKLTSSKEIDHQLQLVSTAYGLDRNFFIPFSSVTGYGKKQIWQVIQQSIMHKGIAYDIWGTDEDNEQSNLRIDSCEKYT